MSLSVLILGGSGFVGRALCEQLTRRFGAEVRITVPTRRLRSAQAVQSLPGVTVLQADVFRELPALLPGQDVVVNLIAILQGSASAFEHAHVELPRRIVAAGVRRLVHISALGVSEQAPSRYLRSKAAGEAVLRTAAQAHGLDLTLLRPSLVFGREDKSVNLFARLQALAPVMPLAGARAQLQPVWVQDLAAAIVECLLRREAVGQTYEIAGPEVLSLADLVRLAGRISRGGAGRPCPVLPLPGPLATLQALAMECLPGEPLLSRDNLASLTVPNVASGRLPGLAALGITAASLGAVLPTYLAPGSGPARLDAWRKRH